MWFVCIFSSFMILLIYFFVRYIWKNNILALLSSLAWIFMPASFGRQVSSIYLKEDFSIIFIILFIILFIVGLKNEKIYIPILGAISLVISLLSWHFSQFMFLIFMGSVFLLYIFYSEWKKHYTRNLIIYAIAAFLCGLFPLLLSRFFIISLPMLIIYAILITLLTEKYWTKKIKNSWHTRFLLQIGRAHV